MAPVDKHQPDILRAQHHSNALDAVAVAGPGSSGDGIEEALHLPWGPGPASKMERPPRDLLGEKKRTINVEILGDIMGICKEDMPHKGVCPRT